MKLELFNEDFIRIGKITQYSYCSYEHDSKEYGKFLIKCIPTERLLSILPNVEYILFEEEVVGVLNYEDIDSVETSNELSLKGVMLKSVLSYRTLFPQFSETLTPVEMLRALVSFGFISNPNPDKNEPKFRLEELETQEEGEKEIVAEEDTITLQVTGSDVFTQCQKISVSNRIFFDVIPALKNYEETEDSPANIESLTFTTRKQRDLSIGNEEGNSPVVFSYGLSNIESSKFNESKENYKNFAVVAGEGSSIERAVEYVTNTSVKMEADENTLMLLHMDSLTDEVERTFTMTKGSTAIFTNENTRFNGKNGHFKANDANGYFQFTNPTLPAGDVTFEWWECRTTPYETASKFPHVLCTDNSTSVRGARLGIENPAYDYLLCQLGTGSSSTNLVPANTPMGNKIYNKWVHRAVVLEWHLNEEDGKYYSTARFYEDGKLFGTYENTTARTAPVAVYKVTNGFIGKYNGGVSAVMYVEEVRISDIARYTGDTYEVPTLPFNVKETMQYVRPKGLKRKELFIDARDLQSTDDKGKALSVVEYKKLLALRGVDKLEDYIVVRSASATLAQGSGKQYEYGKDYMEGDIVTLSLEPIGVSLSIPIAKVVISKQGSIRYTDIVFGDVKNFIKTQLRKENLL